MFTLTRLPLPQFDLLPPHRCFGVYGSPCGRAIRYAAMGGDAPPVIAVDLPGGVIFVDGSHRIAAARMLGIDSILAAVTTTMRAAHRLMGDIAAVGGPRMFFSGANQGVA